MPLLTVVTPFPPYPPYAGGTAHIFRSTRALSQYYDISLYTLSAAQHPVAWGPMPTWCRELKHFPREANRTLLDSRGLLSFDPPAVRHDYSPALAAFLRQRWLASPPDVVQFEFTTMAQYAPLAHAVGALTVCTAHNVAFLAQIRRARQEPNPRLRARRWLGALSLWQYELRALRKCDLVIALADVDAAALRRWLPRLPMCTVPSGIDLVEWPVVFNPNAADEVLFVGNYAHPPNVEGALWFARAVWPRVRRARPTARLTLAGRAPPPEIVALTSDDIAVPGTVDDLQPLYARSSVVVAPIFWGSGIRVKLLEAVACGLPVVTTPLAAEGIPLASGESALFASTPEDFAAAICRLLESPTMRQEIGIRGRNVVEHVYDWPAIARKLAGLYTGIRR